MLFVIVLVGNCFLQLFDVFCAFVGLKLMCKIRPKQKVGVKLGDIVGLQKFYGMFKN